MNKTYRISPIHRHRGASIVEFAVVLPLLILILLAGVDLAWFIHAKMSLIDAVHMGVTSGAHRLQWPNRWKLENGIIIPTSNTATDMGQIASNNIGDLYRDKLVIEENAVLCRCGGTGSLEPCDHTTIQSCTTYRQIHTRMQASLQVSALIPWPGIASSLLLRTTQSMQGDETK